MTCSDLKALIEDVLKNPDFNAEEVDSNMMDRLNRAIEDGDFEIIDMWKEGDGPQEVKFYFRNLEKVLRELMADIRLAGNQHFSFKMSKNSKGERIFGGDANGSVSFELAQLRIGPNRVPLSLVLYIDGTFMKNGMPVRPIYCKLCICDMVISHVISPCGM